MNPYRLWLIVIVIFSTCLVSWAQEKRKVIIDQDAAGPAGTDQQAILLLVQSPQSEVLGVTVVTGDAWLNDEVAHTLRMLELIGRTDVRRSGSRISAGETQRYHRALGATLRRYCVAWRLDSKILSSSGPTRIHA